MDLADVGSWDGDVFRFHEPVLLGGRTLMVLDFSGLETGPGITREDIIHALTHPIAIVEEP